MADDVTKQTGVVDLGKSVSSGRIEVRDSQGNIKPSYFQQPEVIVLPTAVPQSPGNSQPAATQSVANNTNSGSAKGE
jgi:hypothetical protein